MKVDEPSILDSDFTKVDLDLKLKTDRKKYLTRIVGLIIINTILFGLLIKGSRSTIDTFLAALNANLIGFNILGFIIGTIVAVLPYKGLTYKKKYLRSSLLTILTFQIIMTLGLILIGIMTLLGWY
jgi:uncharacterized protein YacL